jgi:hypothetical protein
VRSRHAELAGLDLSVNARRVGAILRAVGASARVAGERLETWRGCARSPPTIARSLPAAGVPEPGDRDRPRHERHLATDDGAPSPSLPGEPPACRSELLRPTARLSVGA